MTASRSGEHAGESRGPAWDAAVRLMHWMLAGLVLYLYFVDDEGGEPHRVLGYVAVGVIVARLLWAGIAEGANGIASLRPSLRQTRAWLRRGAPRTSGHDPLGVWMIWMLWALVLALGVTGWMTRLDAFWGDETLHDVHAWLAHALIASVAVHVLGVATMTWRWRENLVRAMLVGSKRDADRPGAAHPPRARRASRARRRSSPAGGRTRRRSRRCAPSSRTAPRASTPSPRRAAARSRRD